MGLKDQWGTPKVLFDRLDREFNFTLDPCASPVRSLRAGIVEYTEETNGLGRDWKNQRVFVNPPYSDRQIGDWCRKAFTERNNAELIVLLIPVRPDRKYWHDFILGHAEIRFFKGRPKFVPLADQNSGAPSFSSCLVIYRRGQIPRSGVMDLGSFSADPPEEAPPFQMKKVEG